MLPTTQPNPGPLLRRGSHQKHLKTCLLFLIGSLLTLPTPAQEPTKPRSAEVPERTFQVIKRREVVIGDHTITYQLVAPPQTPAPAAAAPAPRVLTPAELETQRRREAKPHRVLFFSATVLDHTLTELSWFDEAGPHRAFSNIDFRSFSGMGEFETADTVYNLMIALDTGTAEALAQRTRDFPQVALLPRDRSAWLLAETASQEGTPMTAALDTLHPFFDTNRQSLIQAHAQREAANAERERQTRENPPARKKTVISYWRKPTPAAQPANPGAAK